MHADRRPGKKVIDATTAARFCDFSSINVMTAREFVILFFVEPIFCDRIRMGTPKYVGVCPPQEVKMPLQGHYYVVPTSSAIHRAWGLCQGRMREYQLLRRHGLKLMWWPSGNDDGVQAADIDWDWIKGLEKKRVGELRIDESINGHVNLRVIFFKANVRVDAEPLDRIWLMTVFPKKRQGFTKFEVATFRAMRDLIVERYYGGSIQA